MLWRGALRRCPWCGGRGAFFTGWFSKQDHCRTCGLGWRRGDVGFELGPLAISIIVCFGTLIAGIGVGVALTAPDVPALRLVLGLCVVAIVLPVVVYPVSYTMWQAIDLAIRPADGSDESVPQPRR